MIMAQLSLYPLRAAHLGPALDDARAAVEATGVAVTIGPMSSTIDGNEEQVFAALRAAFAAVAAHGDAVLVATVSNACHDGG